MVCKASLTNIPKFKTKAVFYPQRTRYPKAPKPCKTMIARVGIAIDLCPDAPRYLASLKGVRGAMLLLCPQGEGNAKKEEGG